MNVLVTGLTFRTLDNFKPVLDHIVSMGGTVSLMLFPNTSDPSHPYLDSLPYPQLLNHPMPWPSPEHLPYPQLLSLLTQTLTTAQPDIILSDCLGNYPAKVLKQALHDTGFRHIPLAVFQHGLVHSWHLYNQDFNCDSFLCFGAAIQSYFLPEHQAHLFPVGLPKLQRLQSVTSADHRYILYIPQFLPPWSDLKPGLEQAARLLNLPILIKPHPMYPQLFFDDIDPETTTLLHPHIDIVPLIANASLVITSGSTSALEALWLRKPLVVIPSPNSTQFPQDLFVTQDLSGEEIVRVAESYTENLPQIEGYLTAHTGGRDFDSVQSTINALESIIANHPCRSGIPALSPQHTARWYSKVPSALNCEAGLDYS